MQKSFTKSRHPHWVADRRAALVPCAGLLGVFREAQHALSVPHAEPPHRVTVTAFRQRANLLHLLLLLQLLPPRFGGLALDGAALDERLDGVPDLDGGHQLRVDHLTRARAGRVAVFLSKPLQDGVPLIDLAIFCNDGVQRQFLSDRAAQVGRDVVDRCAHLLLLGARPLLREVNGVAGALSRLVGHRQSFVSAFGRGTK